MNGISDSRSQQDIESRAAQIMSRPLDPNQTVESLFGPIEDWLLKLGPYTLLLLPFEGTWFYFDPVHENWERTEFKAGQVVFTLEGDRFQAIPSDITPVPRSAPKPAASPPAIEPTPVSAPDIQSEPKPLEPVKPSFTSSSVTQITRPPVIWKIDVLTGPSAGKAFSIDESLSLGRELDNDLIIHDPKISRHHATISRQGDDCLLTDLGSSNGTFLNGVLLSVPVLLSNGDTIVVGDTEMRVTMINER